MPIRSPTTLAVVNFKGGVGKTTMSWCLSDIVTSFSDARVLLFDLDAQMSLTQAVALDEGTGQLRDRFGAWYGGARTNGKTLAHALKQFVFPLPYFDFPADGGFIYEITDTLHFVPSVEELYWLELELLDKTPVRDFMRRLLGRIHNAKERPPYDYVIFDCPPSFTLLSYSVLACCDLILIPVNPDFFAVRGPGLILEGLQTHVQPFPTPRVAVFMNRAKTHGAAPTRETAAYMQQMEHICQRVTYAEQIRAKFLPTWIPERVDIKRTFTSGGIAPELVDPFRRLWLDIVEYCDER